MNIFKDKQKRLIAMIHVPALPGTPSTKYTVNEIIKMCLNEAEIYLSEGIEVLMIENMHDTPYLLKRVGPEIISSMTVIALSIKNKFDVPCGIQILAGANKEAVAVAKSAELDFIRAEGFVFAHVADEGIFQSDAGELLRYRKQISADDVFIYTDIKKKHSSHSITADTNIVETAKAAEFFRSDGLIITGTATGKEADISELINVRENSHLPLLVGSGITNANLEKYFNLADGFIVGSFFKEGGYWENKISKGRVNSLVSEFNRLKANQ